MSKPESEPIEPTEPETTLISRTIRISAETESALLNEMEAASVRTSFSALVAAILDRHVAAKTKKTSRG